MLIEVHSDQYTKPRRDDVIAMLTQARLKPDKLVAHRDRTFTASFLRDRAGSIRTQSIETLDNRVAILKRPEPKIDRGRYITLKLAFVNLDDIGIEVKQDDDEEADDTSPNLPGPTIIPRQEILVERLKEVSKNMAHLVQYAHDITRNKHPREHLLTILDEMQSQVAMLDAGLMQMETKLPAAGD